MNTWTRVPLRGKTLTVDADNGAKLVFDNDALRGIDGQTSGSIQVDDGRLLKEGETADEVAVWYLANGGTMTEISCTRKPGWRTSRSPTSPVCGGYGRLWNNPFL